jgi:hypothetical protein
LYGVVATEELFNSVIKDKLPPGLIEEARKEECLSDDENLIWSEILYQWYNIRNDCPFTFINDDGDYYIGVGSLFDECDCDVKSIEPEEITIMANFLELDDSEMKLYYGTVSN